MSKLKNIITYRLMLMSQVNKNRFKSFLEEIGISDNIFAYLYQFHQFVLTF